MKEVSKNKNFNGSIISKNAEIVNSYIANKPCNYITTKRLSNIELDDSELEIIANLQAAGEGDQ